MARVINTESGARRRKKLMKQMAMALRHAAQGEVGDSAQRDVYAFLSLSLREICSSVDETVIAWEKRDYWVKADRFRSEWIWAEQAWRELTISLEAGDLGACALVAARLAGHVNDVKLPKKAPVDSPWSGAWMVWSNLRANA